MAKVEFRKVGEGESELAFEIKERAFRPYLEASGRWDEAKEREGHARRFRDQEFRFVQCEDRKVGVVALSHTAEGVQLHQLMILPEFQERGFGGSAMDLLLNEAQSENSSVRLRVMKSNPRARVFYGRRGFVLESETETHTHLVWHPR